MTAKVIPFKAEHLIELLKEESAAHLREHLTERHCKALEGAPFTASMELGGEIVMCGGVAIYWHGRGEVWSFYSSACKRNYVPVFRAVKKWLDEVPVRRLELAAEIGNKFAQRQAMLLGFELEVPRLRAFQPNGADCAMYVRIK